MGVTKVLFIKCAATHSFEVYIYIHYSSRCPSMALLSLCIKPLSPITLTPRRSRLSVFTSRNLLIFHDFTPAVSTPSSTGSSRSGCLARSFAREYFRQDVSQNLYRPKGCDGSKGEGEGKSSRSGRRWRRPGWFSRRVSPVTFHYRLITSEYSFRVSPCLLANP